jgi:hypothetical protein
MNSKKKEEMRNSYKSNKIVRSKTINEQTNAKKRWVKLSNVMKGIALLKQTTVVSINNPVLLAIIVLNMIFFRMK